MNTLVRTFTRRQTSGLRKYTSEPRLSTDPEAIKELRTSRYRKNFGALMLLSMFVVACLTTVAGFGIGVYYYCLSAVKQDDFSDIDAEGNVRVKLKY